MTRSLHIIAAHAFWKTLVCPSDTVIDATCGNGHDALFLYHLVPNGQLYGLDIQKEAIKNTDERLKNADQNSCQVKLILSSHIDFPKEISPHSVKLIVYNLGYLPGGNKELTTQTENTLTSLANALALLNQEGALSITLYPGHPEGEKEAAAVIEYAKSLPQNIWHVEHQTFNTLKSSPSLLIIKKLLNNESI